MVDEPRVQVCPECAPAVMTLLAFRGEPAFWWCHTCGRIMAVEDRVIRVPQGVLTSVAEETTDQWRRADGVRLGALEERVTRLADQVIVLAEAVERLLAAGSTKEAEAVREQPSVRGPSQRVGG